MLKHNFYPNLSPSSPPTLRSLDLGDCIGCFALNCSIWADRFRRWSLACHILANSSGDLGAELSKPERTVRSAGFVMEVRKSGVVARGGRSNPRS